MSTITYVSAKMSLKKKITSLIRCIFLVMETMGIVISNNLPIWEFLRVRSELLLAIRIWEHFGYA